MNNCQSLSLTHQYFRISSGLGFSRVFGCLLINPEFLQLEENTTYEIPATNMNAPTTISQRHRMFYKTNANYYEGVFSGKTGYTDESGSTLVTCAQRNGMTLISVVMKSNAENVYNDTRIQVSVI